MDKRELYYLWLTGEWQWRSQRFKCWFVGHKRVSGDWHMDYDPDYCDKCFINWPSEKTTMPVLLNRWYVWMVKRDWRWFEKLDAWLIFKHSNWLPGWWEY